MKLETGELSLERRRMSPPANVAKLPGAIGAALPADVARFLGVGATLEQMRSREDTARMRESALYRVNPAISLADWSARRILSRIEAIRQDAQSRLGPAFADARKGARFGCGSLTTTERHAVAGLLFVRAAARLITSVCASKILRNQIPPFVRVIRQARIEIVGDPDGAGEIAIGSTTNSGNRRDWSGIATGIRSLRRFLEGPPPDQSPLITPACPSRRDAEFDDPRKGADARRRFPGMALPIRYLSREATAPSISFLSIFPVHWRTILPSLSIRNTAGMARTPHVFH